MLNPFSCRPFHLQLKIMFVLFNKVEIISCSVSQQWFVTTHLLVASFYRACHRFRLMKRDDYFWVNFDHFRKRASFFKAAGAVVEISSSLQITNFNQVKPAQICETHCTCYGLSPSNFKTIITNPGHNEQIRSVWLFFFTVLCSQNATDLP